MEYRRLKSNLLGINFSSIPIHKITIEGNFDEGDVLENEKGLILLYLDGNIRLFTNDSMHYVTEEDLQGTFKSNNIYKDEK